MIELEIIVPVYNEGQNIASILEAFHRKVQSSFRLMICYDYGEDNTLPVVRDMMARMKYKIVFVKNRGRGAHSAIMTGFEHSTAPAVLVIPADDTFNIGKIDQMVAKCREGNDIVAPSRFMKGGCMKNCPWLKNVLVRFAAITLYKLAHLPVHDATNGFRLFSRRVLDQLQIESTKGFAFSLELLVKCCRLGWSVCEVPAFWYERTSGKSRFLTRHWLSDYLKWYFFAFATRYLKRPPTSVKMRNHADDSVVSRAFKNNAITHQDEVVNR